MMHLVFLHTKDHLKPRLRGRSHPRRKANALTQHLLSQSFQPATKASAFFNEKCDDLFLPARRLLLGHQFAEETHKIEPFERREMFDSMNLLRKPVRKR